MTTGIKWTKEYAREYSRQWYQKNKERIRQKYYADFERIAKRRHEQYLKNRESILAKGRYKDRIRYRLKRCGLCPVLLLASLVCRPLVLQPTIK